MFFYKNNSFASSKFKNISPLPFYLAVRSSIDGLKFCGEFDHDSAPACGLGTETYFDHSDKAFEINIPETVTLASVPLWGIFTNEPLFEQSSSPDRTEKRFGPPKMPPAITYSTQKRVMWVSGTLSSIFVRMILAPRRGFIPRQIKVNPPITRSVPGPEPGAESHSNFAQNLGW